MNKHNRFIVSDSGAGFCVVDIQTGCLSAFYKEPSDVIQIAWEMNLNPDDATTPCIHLESGARLAVTIKFKDGETITEKKVNEVHQHEETLFLRRYGHAGVEFDQCDIESISIAG